VTALADRKQALQRVSPSNASACSSKDVRDDSAHTFFSLLLVSHESEARAVFQNKYGCLKHVKSVVSD